MSVEQGSLTTDGTTSLGPAPTAVTAESHPTGPDRPVAKKNTWRRALKKDWRLYSFLVLPIVFLLIFRYVPMAGNVIAFRRFRPGGNIFGEEWVGLHYVRIDRKSTRLNSSHVAISYAVFCLKKKKKKISDVNTATEEEG